MSDDPIRDVLAATAAATMGLPHGHVAAWFTHVEAHGGDLEAVQRWVEGNSGWVDSPPEPARTGLRRGRIVAPAGPGGDRRRLVFPASALDEPPT